MRMMGPLTSVLIALVALSSRAVWASYPTQPLTHDSGCWDCNYAPSGFIKGYSGWKYGTAEVGYLRCALVTREDPYFIHKSNCKSGLCYIRKEENGMVYRGCADYENLPWGVKTDVNCKYQGPDKALWWFCDGDSCNRGQLGESEDTCGSPPGRPTYAPDLTETPTPGYNDSSAGGYNPCDGQCHQNPSGLFKDPDRPNHFIQCGCDNHYGRPCTCCKPFYLRCDRNMVFDDIKKVCVRSIKRY